MAAAMAGGYVLGRTKKAKLAFGLAMFVAGRRLKLSPGDLAAAGMRQLAENPQLAGLREQMRGDLYGAVKTAAAAAMDRQVSSLTDSLRQRTEAMAPSADEAEPGGQEEEQDQEQEEEREDEPRDEDEGGTEKEPQHKRRPPARTAAKRTSAKRATTKRTSAKHPTRSER